jgi:hypothetical protein
MARMVKYCYNGHFGLVRKEKGRSNPGYVWIHWEVDEDKYPDYWPTQTPPEGEYRIEYYPLGFNEWRDMVEKYNRDEISYEAARAGVMEVIVRIFPKSLEYYEHDLHERIRRGEIDAKQAVDLIVKASKFYWRQD